MDAEDWLNSTLNLCELMVVSETSTANSKVSSIQTSTDFHKDDGYLSLISPISCKFCK